MQIVNPSAPRATRNDVVFSPVSADTASPSAPNPAGFASLLHQTRAATARAAPAPADEPGSDAPSEAAPDAKAAQEPAQRGRAPIKGKLRAVDAGAATSRTPRPGGEPAVTAGDALAQPGVEREPVAKVEACGSAPIDPSVMHWLAGVQRERSTAPGPAEPGGSEASPVRSAALVPCGAELNDKGAAGKAESPTGASEDRFQSLPTEPRDTESPQAGPFARLAGNHTAAAGGVTPTLAPPPTARHEAAAPIVVAMHAPVAAPEFAQALGVQISVLARDGVQHAELHLNPAEMGPVSVQIVMHGSQAHVDFGADLAATRQAIEAGLPELASALRDAGFTLAGGGVSQHSNGRGFDDRSSQAGTRRAISAEAIDPEAASHRTGRRTVVLGGLDVYA